MDLSTLSVPVVLVYSLLGAIALAYAPYGVTAYARIKLMSRSDVKLEALRRPRAFFDSLPPAAQRAYWAHENSFEALVVYGIAALSAIVTRVDSSVAIYAAMIFLIARALFSVFYIANIAPLRSLMFGIGNICNIVLLSLAIGAAQNL